MPASSLSELRSTNSRGASSAPLIRDLNECSNCASPFDRESDEAHLSHISKMNNSIINPVSSSAIDQRCRPLQDYLQNENDILRLTDKLSELLLHSIEKDWGSGSFSDAVRIALALVDRYPSSIFGQALLVLLKKHANRPEIALGLCEILMSLGFQGIEIYASVILVIFLNNKNSEVIEAAVEVIDNWEPSQVYELLPLLESINVQEPWLRSYIEQVLFSIRK